jgi:hypothetical protein
MKLGAPLLFVCAVAAISPVAAQQQKDIDTRCATEVPSNQDLRDADSVTSAVAPVHGGTIPVFVHVIAGPAGEGTVPQITIDRQMMVLNEAFQPLGWSFSLAAVTTTRNAAWSTMAPGSDAEQQAKGALRQGTARSLNIFVANTPSLGWATFPWNYASKPKLDGIVINASTLPGGSAAPYNLGLTAVHQVGHWMGLLHTFQSACTPAGDQVADTPSERSPALACAVGRDTCTHGPNGPGLDPVTNFMDYSDDACVNQFTGGQIGRMDRMYSAFRLK